ncbi:hypothetical protein [Wolbachia endosymbiont (group A) of Conops quadrifasciatus]|uniref:hypothetical protein n=1 Tax=Wolbachia endosymbiont (group A) of Conops quadrifasciatus TaxID=3066143 RepID=UPI003132DEC4
MPKDNIWKWENAAHITKMVIEGLVAGASLAGTITAILIAPKVTAEPASLALIARPAGIAVLFVAAIYFAAAAYVSYQQMNAIGEKGPQGDKDDVVKTLLDELNNDAVKQQFKTALNISN